MLWLALSPRTAAAPSCPAPDAPRLPWAPAALACWAGRYTPRVSLAGAELLLEVAPSLRLFGGHARLLAQVRQDLAALGLAADCALAPTALAARWLVRGGDGAQCLAAKALRTALAPLPLAVLDLPAELALRLTGFGFSRLGDLLALPRSALGVRTGAGLVLDLARALGEVDDPQPWFEFPERFEQALELPAPVEAAPVLLFAARRLLASLAGWLEARNGALRELQLAIGHGRGHGPPTVLPLRFAAPVHVAPRIERVLKEALERLALPAPALDMRLTAERLEARDARSRALFGGGNGVKDDEQGAALAELLDRLAARLGPEALRVPRRIADHRPERAARDRPPDALIIGAEAPRAPPRRKVSPGGTAHGGASDVSSRQVPASANPVTGYPAPGGTQPLRPLWLLAQPQPLVERNGRPQRNGPLILLTGPERIESGWWDGDDARRDYFIARDAQQAWLWIYRDSRPAGGWFLHGLFS